MAQKNFSIKEALNFGWTTTKKNLGFLLGMFLVAFLLPAFLNGVAQIFKEKHILLSLAVAVLASCLNLFFSLGITKIFLKLYDDQKPAFRELLSSGRLFFKYLRATLLFAGIILGCLVGTFIIGGVISLIAKNFMRAETGFIFAGVGMFLFYIYLAVRFCFFVYFIVDKESGPIESFKQSSNLTKGIVGKLIMFLLVFFGVGLCVFVVLFIFAVLGSVVYALVEKIPYVPQVFFFLAAFIGLMGVVLFLALCGTMGLATTFVYRRLLRPPEENPLPTILPPMSGSF